MRSILSLLSAALLLLLCTPLVEARPAHKKALADFLDTFLKGKLNDCRTCHLPQGKDDERPHNPFGARLKVLGKELRKAGKPADVAARVQAVATEDSDEDGVPNLIELLTGHNPGEKEDVPTQREVAEGKALVVAFEKSKLAYPWRPFEKVQRPPLPTVKNGAWVRNPIDAFVSAEHEAHGLTPRPEASKAVLLRRVTLDLTGLPPTPEELHAFLKDESPDAYEKLVDRLLASPRYGERWGRHWMDVWRYSDWAGWTGGGQIRDSQPHIWRWRDWIIESLNEDRGYDRMILEMLAADELAPDDPKALRATGYLVRNYKMLSREKWLQDTVDHTGMAFLGVTVGCARCHDHMFDPITQREYYQLRAIFEPHQVRIDRLPGQPNTKLDGLARAYDSQPQVPTYLFVRGDDRFPDKSKTIPPGVPEALGGKPFKVEPVSLPLSARSPEKRPFVIEELRAAAQAEVKQAQKELLTAQCHLALVGGSVPVSSPLAWIVPLAVRCQPGEAALWPARARLTLAQTRERATLALLRAEQLEDAGKKNSPAWKQAATEAGLAQRQVAVLEAQHALTLARNAWRSAPSKGKAAAQAKVTAAENALKQAEAKAQQPATPSYTPRPVSQYPATSSGRRLALARWIADRDNPLTARVASNHLWLRHFGQPLVPRVFDFGRNGRKPSHPALLDWLAVEFMEQRWSMKAMHRLLVTSATYRQASTPDETNRKRDPDNIYLWRMNSHRLEAEIVRDCLFQVAGRLDLTMGGPDLDHNQGLSIPRRSLYFRHAAEKQMEFLKLFDAASVTECYQRKESVLPQQALALSNSALTRTHSRLIARALHGKTNANDPAFIVAAYERVLSRPASSAEQTECLAFLREQTRRYQAAPARTPTSNTDEHLPAADPALRARESLIHVLLNHNDFVTVR